MKRHYFIMAFVSLFMVVALCSCDKDDDGDDKKDENPTSVVENNTITAIVENGNSYNDKIDSVKLKTYIRVNGKETQVELASASYSNGGFTLKLPATLSDAYLENAFEDMSDGVTISDPNIRTFDDYYIYAYNESGEEIGGFEYRNTSGWDGFLCYANTDVSVTGIDTDEHGVYNYNIHLKKGWNIGYEKFVEIDGKYVEENTTIAPSGMKWYFDEDEDENVEEPTSGVENNTITAIVENGNSYNDKIAVVKVMMDVGGDTEVEIASAPYSNGGFTLKLPATVSDAYLYTFNNEDLSAGVNISNSNVRVSFDDTYIAAYNKSGEEIGAFDYENSSDWWGMLIYANGDISITGTETYEGDDHVVHWNMHLKRGWNMWYEKEGEGVEEYTTQVPSGTMKWYFYEYSSSSANSVSPKIPSLTTKRKAQL
jgi:hypothetical protein